MAGVETKALKKVVKPHKIRREGSFLLMGLDKVGWVNGLGQG